MEFGSLSVHRDKISWSLGKKLKKAAKFIIVGVAAIPIAPIAAIAIAGTGLAIAGKGIVDANDDLDYIDYVYSLED